MTLLADPNVLRGLLGGYAERVIALEATVESQDLTISHLESEVEEQNYVIDELTPKADYYDTFVESEGEHTLTNTAKALGCKPMAFCAALRDAKLLTKQKAHNVPAQVMIDRGYMVVRPHVIVTKSGERSFPQCLVTSKGIAWLGQCIASGKLVVPRTH